MTEDFNKESTDKGWAAMRQLLDQEMPVEQKRRGIFWWWFVLLLLPITAFGGWQLWLKLGAQPVPNRPVQEIPASSVPMAEQPDAPYESAKKGPSGTAATPIPDNKSSIKSHTGDFPVIKKDTDSKQTHSTAKPTPASIQHISTGTATLQVPNTYEPAYQLPEVVTAGNTQLGSAISFSLNPLPVSPEAVETQLRSSQTSPFRVVAYTSEKIIESHKNSSAWRFGVGAALGTERFSGINSLGAGAVVDWKIGRRLGIRSGLQYSRYTPSNLEQAVALVQPQEYVSAADSGFTVTDGFGNILAPTVNVSLQETVVIPFSRLHMLEAPVLASWRVHRGFKLFAGLNTTFVMLAKTSGDSYSGNLKLAANSDQASKNLNSLAVSDLERWRFDAQVGMGYQWNRHVEIGLFAKFPLQVLSAETSKVEYAGSGAFWPSSKPTVVNQRITSFSLNAAYFF